MAFFTLEKRIALCSLLRAGICNQKQLGGVLGCSDRALRRELSRCRDERGVLDYEPHRAERHRAGCAARSAANVVLKTQGRLLLELYALFAHESRLSPDQVSMLLCRHERSASMHLSTPAIYAWLRRERHAEPATVALWRGRGGRRRSARHGAKSDDRGWVRHAQSIHTRGESVNARGQYGHYECDSLIGRRDERAHLMVTLERKSRYVRLARVAPGAHAAALALHALLPTKRLKSLASDRGAEFAHLPARFGQRFYLCDAHRADQRGSCEHVNGLLREFFPHGRAIHLYSDEQIAHAQDCINSRPRRSLNGLAPSELLHYL
jgi:transposase, IS30 family